MCTEVLVGKRLIILPLEMAQQHDARVLVYMLICYIEQKLSFKQIAVKVDIPLESYFYLRNDSYKGYLGINGRKRTWRITPDSMGRKFTQNTATIV